MNVTTIEQGKHLVELGYPPESADMSYQKTSTGNEEYNWELFIGSHPSIKMNSFSFRNGYVVPAWTLSALLDLVPEDVQLTSKGHTYQVITIKHLIHEYYPSAIDAVYNLLCITIKDGKDEDNRSNRNNRET